MHVHLNPLAFLSTLAPCVLEVPGCLLEQFSDHPPVGAETKVRCLEDVQLNNLQMARLAKRMHSFKCYQ